MKRIYLLNLLLLFCVSAFAQTTDLHYGKPTTKQKKTEKPQPQTTFKDKPYIFNFGDARSILGVSIIKPISKDISFTPGIHFGFTSYDITDYYYSSFTGSYTYLTQTNFVPMINLSFLFRTNNEHLNLKFGPYINIPLTENTDFDEIGFFEEFYLGPGLAVGLDYMFKSGFAIGLTQNLDTYYLSQLSDGTYNSFWTLPSLSLSYRFGTESTRSNSQPFIMQNNNVPNSSPEPIKVNTIDYSKLSDEELAKMLDQATASEKYGDANNIQNEITKRKEESKYSKLSDVDLKAKLAEALKTENYNEAASIQKEIDKRNGLNKSNNKPSGKKSVKELEDDLKKAMDAEDYKKADEIQKEINKLKK